MGNRVRPLRSEDSVIRYVAAALAALTVSLLPARADAARWPTGCHVHVEASTASTLGCPPGSQVAVYALRPGARPAVDDSIPALLATMPQTLVTVGASVTLGSCFAQVDVVRPGVDPPERLSVTDAGFKLGDVLDGTFTGTTTCPQIGSALTVERGSGLAFTGTDALALVPAALGLIGGGLAIREFRKEQT